MKAGEVFDDADEFNVSWLPTWRAMWSPQGQQVMTATPGQPQKCYGLGAVNYYTGETVVLCRRRKRRREVAERLQAWVDKHPTGTIDVSWDHADTHADDAVEALVRAAAGRFGLLYLPTTRGSTRLKCDGGTAAVKSRLANSSSPWKHCDRLPGTSLSATTDARNRCSP